MVHGAWYTTAPGSMHHQDAIQMYQAVSTQSVRQHLHCRFFLLK